jgi:hypothetical protein
MTLADAQLWILKLFRLHPETQDLHFDGLFKAFPPDFEPDENSPEFYLEYLDWETRIFDTDRSWTSFLNKLKRKNVMQQLMLYVDCSELKHYDVLLKAVPDGCYSQPSPVLLPRSLDHVHLHFLDDRLEIMSPKEIAAYIASNWGIQGSPPEVCRLKQKALELRFGTYYDSYNFIPRLLKGIVRANPGSFVDIEDTEVVGCEGFRFLHRIFWALAQGIHAFRYCRPALCVKGTPLCERYQGVLLTALAVDANECLVPVAFAIAESETKESWLWFLRNVKQAVVKKRSRVCIIHDCKAELVNAVDDIQNNPEEQHPWKDVQSRWCMQHLAENFLAYFEDKKLMTLFKKLCQQKQGSKFADIWKELDELTLKCAAEKKREEAELGEEGNRGVGSQIKIMNFSGWIHLKPKEKWSLLYDTNNARYGIMGIDMSDAYKHDHVLKGILCLPLSAIVKVTFNRMVEYFKNTSAAANEAINNPAIKFPQRVQDGMDLKMQKARMHQVICMNPKNKNVVLGDDVAKYVVQSGHKRVAVRLYTKSTGTMKNSGGCTVKKRAACSCNKLRLLHRPCSHVMAVCSQIGVSTSTYMSRYYSLSYLGNTWSAKFVLPDNLHDYHQLIDQFSYIYSSESKMPTWIPDKKLECGLPVFLTSDFTETGTDVEEQE